MAKGILVVESEDEHNVGHERVEYWLRRSVPTEIFLPTKCHCAILLAPVYFLHSRYRIGGGQFCSLRWRRTSSAPVWWSVVLWRRVVLWPWTKTDMIPGKNGLCTSIGLTANGERLRLSRSFPTSLLPHPSSDVIGESCRYTNSCHYKTSTLASDLPFIKPFIHCSGKRILKRSSLHQVISIKSVY